MKRLVLLIAVFALFPLKPAYAGDLSWDFGYGSIGLPFESTEALLGYDIILEQAIGGASIPVLKLGSGKWEVDGHVGAVGAWPTNSPAVEPYLALGKDIAPYVPVLNQFKSIHLNGFGRYSTTQGKWGSGFSVSYSFN